MGGYFSTKVGLFRCVKGFLCQTGIAGAPAVFKQWDEKGQINDDPQWLSESDDRGMKRGYLSFGSAIRQGGGRGKLPGHGPLVHWLWRHARLWWQSPRAGSHIQRRAEISGTEVPRSRLYYLVRRGWRIDLQVKDVAT